MFRGLIVAASILLFCGGAVVSATAGESVTFAGPTAAGGHPLTLAGMLTKPSGDGPFPAVVLLHGCSGIHPHYDVWADRLVRWGYVALQVDSLKPRGETYICDNVFAVHPFTRAKDAHAAKAYLTGLPFVRGDRIGVLGWSHGGWTTLWAVHNPSAVERWPDPFRAAIVFYPWCRGTITRLDAPLLILIGEGDDWTPALRCRKMALEGETAHNVSLTQLPQFEGSG